MSSPLPNDLSLTVINDGAQIVASDHRNNYAAVQAAVNALRDALAGGTVGQVVSVVDSTHIQLGLVVNANVDPAAAISLSKLAAGTNHTLLLSGASTVGSLSAGSAKQLLQSGGAAADPAWASLGAVAAGAQATPGGPHSSNGSSATAVMLGLSSGTTFITPNSTRLLITVSGFMSGGNNGGTDCIAHVRYGTGNGPALNAAVTGTQVGHSSGIRTSTTEDVPFASTGLVTGLTPGTALWVDLDAAGDGTHTLSFGGLVLVAYDLI